MNTLSAHQTSDMSRCTISPESRLKLEMVILSNLRFLTILTFQYVNYQFMCPDFNKHELKAHLMQLEKCSTDNCISMFKS